MCIRDSASDIRTFRRNPHDRGRRDIHELAVDEECTAGARGHPELLPEPEILDKLRHPGMPRQECLGTHVHRSGGEIDGLQLPAESAVRLENQDLGTGAQPTP